MLILFTTPSFLQKFVAVTDSRLPSRFHSLVCFVLWGDSFPVRMCSLNYSMRISFPDITHFSACHIVLFHSFSSGSLKDVLNQKEKLRWFQRSLKFCVRLPLYVVGLIYLGVKASLTRPHLVVLFVVENSVVETSLFPFDVAKVRRYFWIKFINTFFGSFIQVILYFERF